MLQTATEGSRQRPLAKAEAKGTKSKVARCAFLHRLPPRQWQPSRLVSREGINGIRAVRVAGAQARPEPLRALHQAPEPRPGLESSQTSSQREGEA